MIKNNEVKNTGLFSKKIIGLLLTSLIFPAVILAQEPNDGVLLTGLFTDSGDTREQEILNQGVAKTFNVRLVWTYDQTDIITGPLEAFAAAKNIPSSNNGLEEPLLSEISGYQRKVIAHSASVVTAVSLAKQGKLWGGELYLVSPALTSQDDLKVIRDLTSQGKGFNKIVLYTGDDIIPDFKELQINFKDYTMKAKIIEDSEASLIKLVYEDRDRTIDVLKFVLNDFATRAKEQLGREPASATIYGDIPGNKFEIIWEDGSKEMFYLQKDALTGENFYDETGIKIVPLYEGFPHVRAQLEVLEKFYKEHNRMPENNKEDIAYFKQSIQKASSEIITAHDPNELIVSPEGNVRPGERLTYTINYENEGEGIAYGVYFTDTLEEDLDDSNLTIGPVIDSSSGQQLAGPGIYNPETRTITWFVGEVGSRQGGSAEFSVKVKDTTPDGSEVINYATVYFPSVPEATRTNGTVNKVTTFVDNIAPVTTILTSPTSNSAGWNNADVTISLAATDNEGGSGVSKTEYSLDGTSWIAYTAPFAIATEGTTTVYYKSIDNAGNVEPAKTLTVKLDKTPPTITSQVSPQPNQYSWNNTDVTVSFTAQDTLSGIASVTQPQTITTEGKDQNIGAEATDLADNTTTTYVTLNIDKTPPTITTQSLPSSNSLGWNNNDVTVSFKATDNLSGIQSITQPITVSTEGANQLIKGEAKDYAGNKATTSIALNIDKIPPTVNITATPNTLWPPNHKLTNVTIGGSAADNLSGIASNTFKVADEYKSVEPIILGFNTAIQLEAWRNGDDLDGRTYTISTTTKDKADNQASASTTIICPHDERRK